MGRRRYERLFQKAIYAAMAAVDAYNKALSPYKQEIFAILMANAWELLLKAKWVHDHGNDYKSLYERLKNGRYKRNRSGNPITYGLTYLINQMRNEEMLSENVYNNLLALVEIRDNAVHLYLSPHLHERIHNIALATTRNFYLLLKNWFGGNVAKPLESAIVYSVPFTIEGSPFKGLKREERLFRFLQRMSENQKNDPQGFFVAAEIQLKFVRSRYMEEALAVKIDPNNPDALSLELTEEQWGERYPWTYGELLAKLRERYEDFKQDRDFYELKRRIEPDSSQCDPKACYNKYCRIRFLDPSKPRSNKKKFYSPAVLEYFDKFYTRKEK